MIKSYMHQSIGFQVNGKNGFGREHTFQISEMQFDGVNICMYQWQIENCFQQIVKVKKIHDKVVEDKVNLNHHQNQIQTCSTERT